MIILRKRTITAMRQVVAAEHPLTEDVMYQICTSNTGNVFRASKIAITRLSPMKISKLETNTIKDFFQASAAIFMSIELSTAPGAS